jgi:hypothetical protein
MRPCKNQNNLYTLNIQWHRINILTPKEKNWDIERRNRTKTPPKLSRANINSCGSKSSIQGCGGVR